MLRAYIKDLKVGDVVLNQQFGLLVCTKKLGRTGNEYYEVILSDKTGQIDAKIWANAFYNCAFGTCKEGDVVEITGKIDSFNEKPQLIIEKMNFVKDYDHADFMFDGTRNKQECWDYIISEVTALDDLEIKELILNIFSNEEFTKKFKATTAAEYVHHDFVGGLLEHVFEMLKLAKAAKELYPQIKYSELAFGVLFHDIGKLEEYSANGIALSRTKSGFLLGHITQGLIMLEKLIPASLDIEKKDRLLHMIASHHGEKEKGSPVQPATLEALMLSQIDDMSSKAGIFYTHSRNNIPDEMGFLGYNKYLGANLLSS